MKIRRNLKKFRNKIFLWIAKYTIPYLYMAYIRFVWWTSVFVKDETSGYLDALNTSPYKFVAALWHQDVFCVAWAYQNLQAHTIASVGDGGEIISKMLKMCNFTEVVRGGSSAGRARHRKILPDLIELMNHADRASCGITVDGSKGPPYRLKRGVIALAKECRIPVFVSRLWCKRRLLLPTWDRTMIPLPFNKFVILARGPYVVPENIDDEACFESFRSFIEDRLFQATYDSFMLIDGFVPERLAVFFPDDWQPDEKRT